MSLRKQRKIKRQQREKARKKFEKLKKQVDELLKEGKKEEAIKLVGQFLEKYVNNMRAWNLKKQLLSS